MKYYYLVGRLLSPGMTVIFYLYNTMRRASRPRVLLFNTRGEILLVRSCIGPQGWELPGGGAERGEPPSATVQRELREEVGITVSIEAFSYVGTTRANGYTAPVYMATLYGGEGVTRNVWELSAAEWFDLRALPDNRGPVVAWALKAMSK